MATQIQLRQGTTTEHNTFTGAVGEVTVDTTKDVVVVHDGVTVGGHPVAARANADGSIELIKKDGTSAGTINSLGLFNNTLTSTNTNQALTAAQAKKLNDQAFGVGQTWMDVFSSRVIGTTYTNTTGKPIMVVIWQAYDSVPILYIDDIKIAEIDGSPGSVATSMSAVVPNGSTYRVSKSINGWVELR